MRKRKPLAKDINEIKTAMENTRDKSEYRRLQCIYLGDTMPEMTAKDIAKATLYSEDGVKKIHATFRETGMESIKDKRGGRHRENLTLKQEEELLEKFDDESASGKLVETSRIKVEYEKQLGRKVNKTVIYRMLDRHGFRKIVPYKRHPKANREEQEAFKKNSKAQ
jgi:transposase